MFTSVDSPLPLTMEEGKETGVNKLMNNSLVLKQSRIRAGEAASKL